MKQPRKIAVGIDSIGRTIRVKHGHNPSSGRSRVYNSWAKMKARCLNPKIDCWAYYGGRGITVCERWMEFDKFYEDMGDRPMGTTLDRINTNLGYFKENCRWSTRKEQMHNTRRNKWIEYGGLRLTISQWAIHLKYSRNALMTRLKSGWSMEKIVNTPIAYRKPRQDRQFGG